MDHVLTIAGLLGAAAITPGPNNLVILRAAAQDGLRGAMPALFGVVLGGLLLLAVAMLGAGSALVAHPQLRGWIVAGGALYLIWLGGSLLAAGIAPRRGDDASDGPPLPAGTLGLIGFQFLNPKSWVMVLTVLAAWPVSGLRGYLPLATLFVLIPGVCLLAWAALGTWCARRMMRVKFRRGVDIAMGALLAACAGALLLER
jgi:threonine/homoserine/homoserine lactone efflux protein